MIHVEFTYEDFASDLSDSWYCYDYKCDLCGSTENDYLSSNDSEKTVAELREKYYEKCKPKKQLNQKIIYKPNEIPNMVKNRLFRLIFPFR